LQDAEIIELYGKVAWLTIIIWSFYPIVWLFSEGFASFSVSFEVPPPPPLAARVSRRTGGNSRDAVRSYERGGTAMRFGRVHIKAGRTHCEDRVLTEWTYPGASADPC
jgi:hypothetical protein